MPMSSQAKVNFVSKEKDPQVATGYERLYTGTTHTTAAEQTSSSDRLSKGLNKMGVADAKRIIPRDVKQKAGVTHSFQWTAGGQACHGFVW